MIGQTLSHYQIIEKLGEGGMGVVYRGVDTRLNRPVALKVLPREAMADEERVRRLVQEARAASALNHPNIVTVYDVGAETGVHFIAMEYLAGNTLDRLIGRKGLPLGDALKHAIQIADALAAAHAAGIVHRDLKPGNVIVTDRGIAKVLDFRLAKVTEPDDADGVTRVGRARTEEGTILGTVAYMSPEQAQGKPVDARSDIFAFGSLLYEMVTGRRPFEAENRVSTLCAILEKEPVPPGEIVGGIPRELERILAQCLRKDPKRRFQHLDDVKVLLETLQEDADSGRLAVEPPSRPVKLRKRVWPPVAAVFVVTAATGLAWWLTRDRSEGPVLTGPPTRLTFDSGLTTEPVLSPDAKLVAYASDRAGADNLDIWVQNLAGGEATRLTSDPADEREPDFSPDGSKVTFRSEKDGGGIYVMPSIGGDSRLIATGGRRPKFSPDGRSIVYYVGHPDVRTALFGQIHIVPSTGGVSSQVRPDGIDIATHPLWTPDGKRLLFVGGQGSGKQETSDWWVTPVDGGAAIKTGAFESFSRRGLKDSGDTVPVTPPDQWVGDRVVFSGQVGDSRNVWQVRVSRDTWQVAGVPEQLTSGTSLEGQPSMVAGSERGSGARLVFASLTSTINTWRLAIDANQGKVAGEPRRLTSSAYDGQASISSDGKRLAFASTRSGNLDIWLKDLETGKEIAVTSTPGDEFGPEITDDGTRVFYQTIEKGVWKFFVVPVDSAGQPGVPRMVCDGCTRMWDPSSDNRKLLYLHRNDPFTAGLFDLDTNQGVELIRHSKYNVVRLRFSPDDRWIAFNGVNDQGRSGVFVVPFRGTSKNGQSVPEGGDWVAITGEETFHDKPVWSLDGNLLYFTSDDDGYRCIWARPLHRATKRPVGGQFAVYHSHSARRSLLNADILKMELAVGADKLVFQLGEITGNIWMATLR